mmetsp:Transcript_47939/g.147927  ORF Transcript_47939/g.147927 Transcript_47939/m.147927 type:complete len:301 (-) Transcript_47939:1095-1997(-)
MPTMPRKMRSDSTSSREYLSIVSPSPMFTGPPPRLASLLRRVMQMVRRPRDAKRVMVALISTLSSSVRSSSCAVGTSPSRWSFTLAVYFHLHRFSTRSGAPLVVRKYSPVFASLYVADMRLMLESKEYMPVHWYLSSPSYTWRGAATFQHMAWIAISVGLPLPSRWFFSSFVSTVVPHSAAALKKSATRRSSRRSFLIMMGSDSSLPSSVNVAAASMGAPDTAMGGRSVPIATLFTTILFCVRVPVLSEQMSVTLSRTSREPSLRTMHFWAAILRTEMAMETATTATRDCGRIAMATAAP